MGLGRSRASHHSQTGRQMQVPHTLPIRRSRAIRSRRSRPQQQSAHSREESGQHLPRHHLIQHRHIPIGSSFISIDDDSYTQEDDSEDAMRTYYNELKRVGGLLSPPLQLSYMALYFVGHRDDEQMVLGALVSPEIPSQARSPSRPARH